MKFKAIHLAPLLHVHILLVVVHLAPVFHVHVLLAPDQPDSAVLLKHMVSASTVLDLQDSSMTRVLHGQVVDCVSYTQS